MSNTLTQILVDNQEVNDNIHAFLKAFHVSELLRQCHAYKVKGFSVIEIFTYILSMMFSQTSIYMSMRIGTYKEKFAKNTIYRFCNNAKINWHKFVRLLSKNLISDFIRPATSEKRNEYFVIDDTPFPKSGKCTELVGKYFNHVTNKFEYGYRILSLIWTDEYTNIPVDFSPLSSSNNDLLLCGAKKCDKRSIAGKTRKLAQEKAPVVVYEMLKKALNAGHSAKYVLFDTWFAMPKLITQIKNNLGLDVIAMIKKTGKVYYEYENRQLSVEKIFSINKKRPGKSKYLLSVNVNIIQKENKKIISRIPAKIVYVRNKSKKKDWIAIVSTDIDIYEEEIIRRYGNRWNIEVYFKTSKQYLKMLKECNSTSFDSFTCHLAIVAVRYMMLSYYERAQNDGRSLGELFWLMIAEVVEISFNHA